MIASSLHACSWRSMRSVCIISWHHKWRIRKIQECSTIVKWKMGKRISPWRSSDHHTCPASIPFDKTDHCLYIWLCFWSCLKTTGTTIHLGYLHLTFYSDIECVEVKLGEGFDEDDAFYAGARIVEYLLGFDMYFEMFALCIGIAHNDLTGLCFRKFILSSRWN